MTYSRTVKECTVAIDPGMASTATGGSDVSAPGSNLTEGRVL
jgi:hypothetical protein